MQDQIIEQSLQNFGVKPTAMRILVYRVLATTHSPISLKQLEDKMVTADRSTIFRTLSVFVQHRLVHTIEDGSGSLKYELCTSHDHHVHNDEHVHFYCECCKRTFCLHHLPLPEMNLPADFVVRSANFILKGFCPNCREKGTEC